MTNEVVATPYLSSQDEEIYFAYGSNMLSCRLQERVPSARALGVATLSGHQLLWHKVSKKDGSGKCDVVAATPEAEVYGVLFGIAQAEKPKLDAAEGLGAGYAERQVVVVLGGRPVTATMYYATNINAELRPYSWYRELVVAGAREHGLPAAYLAALEDVPVLQDPDAKRHAEHMALVAGR
ncbi:gamma-glutamylcyclotransferase family protein [Methyloversatilis discipulorum]|uniref:gamma-glutamylcyclotransferase family protein n=1 Tax=Methyloversatilis discipulorum TaxID=1119528 RepID=UPI003AF533BD